MRNIRRSSRIALLAQSSRKRGVKRDFCAGVSSIIRSEKGIDLKGTKHARASKCSRKTKASPSGFPSREYEQDLWDKGYKLVAGVDEAGRGPLVGPVVAAACIIDPSVELEGVKDSKKMTEGQRENMYEVITNHPKIFCAWHAIDAKAIDEINILQAALKAMSGSVAKLEVKPDYILVDGNRIPKEMVPRMASCIIKGDSKSLAIAAASIIAKVTRDRMMMKLHKEYPQYGFDKHKGYGTPQHLSALEKHGPCPQHRRTFAPIKFM